MESAIAGAGLGRYRRIVQMFWDPEPVNDAATDQPVWCLGRSYRLSDKPAAGSARSRDANDKDQFESGPTRSSPRRFLACHLRRRRTLLSLIRHLIPQKLPRSHHRPAFRPHSPTTSRPVMPAVVGPKLCRRLWLQVLDDVQV